MLNGFDWLTRLLVSIDAIKLHWWGYNKRHIDDYYAVLSTVDDFTMKMHDGSMVTFFRLKGYGAILTDLEKLRCSKTLEDKLKTYFTKPGFQLQIVDNSDPELTRRKVNRSMKSSIEELNNIGLGDAIFTTDYMEHVIANSVWKEQYIVVKTSPESIRKEMYKSAETAEDTAVRRDKERFAESLMEKKFSEQGLFLSEEERQTYIKHETFRNDVKKAFKTVGGLISSMNVKSALIAQKEVLYGAGLSDTWTPTLDSMDIVSKPQSEITEAGRLKEPDLAAQILSNGITEENLPPHVIRMGDRFYTTLSMIMGQPGTVGADGVESRAMKSYASLVANIPRNVPYLISMTIESEPFTSFAYKVDKVYVGMSSILPFTDNSKILQARKEIENRHREKIDISVYMTITVTIYAGTLESLSDYKNKINSALDGWGDAQFRAVEMDKVQGLLSAVPGATLRPKMTRVLESFSAALYQSALFMDGISYESGFLHYFTDLGMPFPLEEQSSKNKNYNAYTCGESGTGKSTLLSLTNLALLAKPKANPKLRGEVPLIFNVDFGKTSFGLTRLVQKRVSEKKRLQFLCHEMTTGIESSYNVHDLPIGRNRPTMRHKAAIIRFLRVLIFGIEFSKEKGFVIQHDDAKDMISFLVDEVYNFLDNSNNPRMFDPAEFQYKQTLNAIKEAGLPLSTNISYYSLADMLMKKDPSKNVGHAILLRRYAMPRLGDYSQLLAVKGEIAVRYDKSLLSNGATYKDFFVRRIGEITREYQCFSSVTRINVDLARMISIDIKNVCGEDTHRKAIFGSLCLLMYMTKKENSEESEDLFDDVTPEYLPFLKRMDEINRFLPGVLNIEEAHVLINLFEPVLNDVQRQNRKANWGLKTFSQRLSDPSDDFFSLCSAVFITSDQASTQFEPRFKEMGLSLAERNVVRTDLSKTLTTFFAYIRTNAEDGEFPRIAIRLQAAVTSGLIWATNSNQLDINFFDAATESLGFEDAIQRLQRFFPGGQVRKYYEMDHIKEEATQKGFSSVFEFFLDAMKRSDTPDSRFVRMIQGA